MNRIVPFLLFGIIGVLTLHACSKARKMQKVDHPEPVVQNEAVVTEESAAPSTLSAWEQACEQNSIESYTEFLKKYPNDRHANEAWERIEELWAEKTAMEEAARQSAQNQTATPPARTGTPEPATTSTQTQTQPDPSAPVAEPDPAPSTAQAPADVNRPGTKAAATTHGRAQPATTGAQPGAHSSTPGGNGATSGEHPTSTPPASTVEEKDWDYASHSTSIPVIERFVQNHPESVHRAEAEKRIVDLEVDKIMAGKPAKLPPLEKVKDRPGSGNNTVTIRNYTDYQLSVWFSGPGSVKKVLSSGQHGTLHLPNGSYRVAAAVNSASVSTYAATEQLNGGEYESDFYIISAKD